MKPASLFFTFFFLLPSLAQSAGEPLVCKKKICFEASRQISGSNLPLHGVELLEYVMLDLYTAALYAPAQNTTIESILGNTPKSLILHYHRTIKKELMIRASRDRIQKNSANNPAQLEDRLKQLDAAYQKVTQGDRYELRYEPGTGTSLILNGKLQATIPGEDFQQAFFGIWLSEVPLNKKLRDKLLKLSH